MLSSATILLPKSLGLILSATPIIVGVCNEDIYFNTLGVRK